jgi:DNA-binding MarR family transcriptional regulator
MDDQELDGLYARLRDAEDARKAAVGIIEKQNEALARVRALHVATEGGECKECSAEHRDSWVEHPCSTLKAAFALLVTA